MRAAWRETKATSCITRAGKDGLCSTATISRSLAPCQSFKSYSLMAPLVLRVPMDHEHWFRWIAIIHAGDRARRD